MTLLERRRELIAAAVTNASILPSGYTQLEYIQSDGTQYIVTDFIPNQDTRVVVDFQFVETGGVFLFGSRQSYITRGYSFNISSQGYFASAYANEGNKNISRADTDRHVLNKDKNEVYWDEGSVPRVTSDYVEFNCPKPMTIFACYNASTPNSYMCKAKIYSFKIYNNDILAKDYIPCINPNGEVGLYDIVNKAFVGNSGSGTLIGGEL